LAGGFPGPPSFFRARMVGGWFGEKRKKRGGRRGVGIGIVGRLSPERSLPNGNSPTVPSRGKKNKKKRGGEKGGGQK